LLIAATAVTLAVIVAVSASLWRRIVDPATAQPTDVDAVVILSGGHGERLPRGLAVIDQLNADGRSPVLVLSTGNRRWVGWDELEPYCDSDLSDPDAYGEILCVTPDPDTTRGEASLIATLADERDWTSIALVTSNYHLERATMLVERCLKPFGTTVVPVSAEVDIPGRLLRHEFFGLLHAHTVGRACD
jgi:uncharacterized SAM-binding protein YcdF (DUF218 family)